MQSLNNSISSKSQVKYMKTFKNNILVRYAFEFEIEETSFDAY